MKICLLVCLPKDQTKSSSLSLWLEEEPGPFREDFGSICVLMNFERSALHKNEFRVPDWISVTVPLSSDLGGYYFTEPDYIQVSRSFQC